MKLVAAVVALVLAGPTAGLDGSVRYLQSRQQTGGAFAEPAGQADPSLTAWTVLGLSAAGSSPGQATVDYLRAHEEVLESVTDVELVLLAEAELGRQSPALLGRLRAAIRPSGAIGPSINSTIWGVLALRRLRLELPRATTRFLLARQSRSGGWSWAAGVQPDSNDTAAAIQALRSLGVSGAPIRRGLALLLRFQGRGGGFRLTEGRPPDTQSTAWAIQAFLAAGRKPGRAAYAFLARMHRPDGSFRFSARYAATPVWVTAQVLPALSGKPFPLR